MKLEKTKGIVLKSVKYSETSLIVNIYTQDFGLKSMMVSGSRKNKSAHKANLFQLMNLLEIVFYNNESDHLSRLKEVKIYHPYDRIPFDVVRANLGTFLLEVTRNCIREHETNAGLFGFMEEWFGALDQQELRLRYFHITYLLELSRLLGFYPLNNASETLPYFDLLGGEFVGPGHQVAQTLSIESSKLFQRFLNADLRSLLTGDGLEDISNHDRDAMLDHLIRYIGYHVTNMRPIKSLDVLRTILS